MEKTSQVERNGAGEDEEVLESENLDDGVGRCRTDAVHERMKINYIYCDDCNVKIQGDAEHISKHFSNSHPSNARCLYCRAKVFTYKSCSFDDEGAEIIKEEYVYHRCSRRDNY